MTSDIAHRTLQLWCFIDLVDNPITTKIIVTAPLDTDINDLKRLIHEDSKNRLHNIDANSLVLWKLRTPIVVKPTRDVAERIRKLGNTYADFADELDELVDSVSDVFSSPLEGRLYIIVEPPSAVAGTKRPFSEDIDATDHICHNLMHPFKDHPTSAQALVSLIRAPLLDKLPLPSYRFNKIVQDHPLYAKIFQPANGDLADVVITAISTLTGQLAQEGQSEDMLHYLVDVFLRAPLTMMRHRVGMSLPIQIDRNRTDAGASTQAQSRPDFLLWCKDTLILWGEEKAGSGALDDLKTKFQGIDPLTFGNVKFMMCYAMNGSRIRFYAIDADHRLDPFVPLTEELDMIVLKDRLDIFLATINIARVIVTIKDDFPTVAYPLLKRIKLHTSEIWYNIDHVEKRVELSDLPYSQTDLQGRIDFLRNMYQHAKRHRGLVEVKDGPRLSKNSHHYIVTLVTRGISFRPRTEDELRQMTRDLVLGLNRLHSGDYLHRDIRYPNVLYNPAARQYFLIDFEHGAREGTTLTDDDGSWLKEWDEGTLDNGKYTKMSDLYQLGKLLWKNFQHMITSQNGKKFLALLDGKKMRAHELLEQQWLCL